MKSPFPLRGFAFALLTVPFLWGCQTTTEDVSEPVSNPDAGEAIVEVPPDRELLWSAVTPLPPVGTQNAQPGLAGAFAGIHNGALIIAGGANFPAGPFWLPTENGAPSEKVYHSHIYYRGPSQSGWNIDSSRLPQPFSYGVSIPTRDGIYCIGGELISPGGQKVYSDSSVLLSYDPVAGQVMALPNALPPLPQAVSMMGGASVGRNIFILGGGTANGATTNFWVLDLDNRTQGWQTLPTWPGAPRMLPVVVAQQDSQGEAIFLFGGRNQQPGAAATILTDAYKFDIGAREWSPVSPVGSNESRGPMSVMGGAGVAVGDRHILIFGGDDGDLFAELAAIGSQLAAAEEAGNADAVGTLTSARNQILSSHPGFSRLVLGYNTHSDYWGIVDTIPERFESPVTTTAVKSGDDIILPTGEISPGIRSPQIIRATLPPPGE